MRRRFVVKALVAALAWTFAAGPALAFVEPTPTPTPSSSGLGDARTGGSPSAPSPGKPGWVWWVTAAFVVVAGVGGYRIWRSMRDDPSAVGESLPPDS